MTTFIHISIRMEESGKTLIVTERELLLLVYPFQNIYRNKSCNLAVLSTCMFLPLVFYVRFLYFPLQCKGKKCREGLAFTASLQIFSSHKWNFVQLYSFVLMPHHCTEIILLIFIKQNFVITVHKNLPYNLALVF